MKRWNTLDPLQVKASIQEAFECWGLPESIRVDNGTPWGTTSAVPSAMALWWAGLGITVRYGRRARSTDNAVIERCNGVLAQWVEPERQPNLEAFQQQLEWAGWTQRERYRSPHHLTRAQAYPDLYDNLRTYRRQQEAQRWDAAQAAVFLSGYSFQRKVEKNGRINLMSNVYSVGRAFARQTVTVYLHIPTNEWVVHDDYGREIRRFASKELNYEQIRALQLTRRPRDRHNSASRNMA